MTTTTDRVLVIAAHPAAAAGEPALVEKLKKGHKMNGRTYKVHLDGTNLISFLSKKEKDSLREWFLYWSDDGDLMAIRVKHWKVVFMEQHGEIGEKFPAGPWSSPFTVLRVPKMYNLRADPFERGAESQIYPQWFMHKVFLLVPAQGIVSQWLASFKEFPPRAKAASFTVGDAMKKIEAANPN